MYENKKITLATVKSFVKKNKEALFINVHSSFSGMSDCIETNENQQFKPIKESGIHAESHTLGIQGAWFVNQSRDCFRPYDKGDFTGIYVFNCCGSFTLAIKKACN